MAGKKECCKKKENLKKITSQQVRCEECGCNHYGMSLNTLGK